MKSKRIGVICGGFSVEREVSLRTGQNVYDSLLRQGYDAFLLDPLVDGLSDEPMEVAFNALHGTFGEDGAIQSLLDSLGIAYTGSGVSSSVIGMNKYLTKQIMLKDSLPTPESVLIHSSLDIDAVLCGFPRVLKPLNEGSSVGVCIVHDEVSFRESVKDGLERYGVILCEAYVKGKEITVGLLEYNGGLKALPPLELRSKRSFYDYEAKYTKGLTEFVMPATLTESDSSRCQELALRLHDQVGCSGYSRVDMVVCPTDGPFLLEINTLPGLTETSDLPAQAQAVGLSFDQLVEAILWSVRDEA